MQRLLVALALSSTALLVACGGGSDPGEAEEVSDGQATVRGTTLRIVSGSENKGLEPVVEAFARERGVEIEMRYLGSVDMSLELRRGASLDADAVWPANSLWIVLGDRDKVVKHEQSIMRSPVVFGVKQRVAERLGWIGTEVRVEDVLNAAESGQLRFAMTSATQSNSGASAYFGFLSAMAGSPEVLDATHLADVDVRSKVRRLLQAVDRSSGSSGWLKTMFLDRYARFDAMVNYEAMVIEANQELERRGDEPLVAIYPVDGMTIADSPLGYVDKGDADKEALFLALQEYLLSKDVQSRIGELGRRTGLIGLGASDPNVFRKSWGIDTERVLSIVPVPAEGVVREALDLYQTALRKPSLTAYVLDFSGSMNGDGERQLKDAMATLLDSATARRFLLQPSADDVHLVVPFDGEPRGVWSATGNADQALRQLLDRILDEQAGGGTDIYDATADALLAMRTYEDSLGDFFPAIIVMSDGKSKNNEESLRRTMDDVSFGYDVPIFTIAFGKADPRQLEALSEATSGRSFDGKKDLVKAFRSAKGYN
ncbi:MAG: substrate-binding domain-containing protein [Acidobacteriota bacterium]